MSSRQPRNSAHSLELVAADATERKVLVVDFSDGTTAYFTVEQLMRLRCSRVRTGHWPLGHAMPNPVRPSRAPALGPS